MDLDVPPGTVPAIPPWFIEEMKGFLGRGGGLPPLPPPPPPPADPLYLGGYIYPTREAAREACRKIPTGAQRLCFKAELVGHPRCDAGWCEDFEGYWEDAVYKDCGDKGFNSWSGAAGAYCCSGRQ